MKNAVELGRAQRPALPGPGDTLQGSGLPCGALGRRRGGGAGDRGGPTALATWPRTAGPGARSVVPFVALVTRVTKVPSPFSTCTESPNVSAPTGSKVRPTSPPGWDREQPPPPMRLVPSPAPASQDGRRKSPSSQAQTLGEVLAHSCALCPLGLVLLFLVAVV